ncbi:MAG: OB-fold nucleic acid binding domain-containing protein, partial [Gammaproteobacteria bacterium]
MSDEQLDENKLIAQRRSVLSSLRESGEAFPNDFRRDVVAGELRIEYESRTKEELEELGLRVKVAGRLMSRRIMGKASFANLQDMSGGIQLYIARDAIGEEAYSTFKKGWDVGDIIGAEGMLTKTNKGELSVRCDSVVLLTKSLRPLPEKFHGLTDQEQRYRMRYLDLIMNETSRETFRIRTRVVQFLRNYLNGHGFMEVET